MLCDTIRQSTLAAVLLACAFSANAASFAAPPLGADLTQNSAYRPTLYSRPGNGLINPSTGNIDISVEPNRGGFSGLSSGCNVYIGNKVGGFGFTEINVTTGDIKIDC